MVHPVLPLPPPSITDDSARFKYIDDLSMCQAVNLSDVIPIDGQIDRPLNFRDSTMHHLPNDKNQLQKQMDSIHKFCDIQNFRINEKKTQTVVFNTATSKDFSPNITNAKGELYQNTENFKLLGVDFSTGKRKGINLDNYVNNCINRGFKNLWILRRFNS